MIDSELIHSAIRNNIVSNEYRWITVSRMFNLDKDDAYILCNRFDIDPDSVVFKVVVGGHYSNNYGDCWSIRSKMDDGTYKAWIHNGCWYARVKEDGTFISDNGIDMSAYTLNKLWKGNNK